MVEPRSVRPTATCAHSDSSQVTVRFMGRSYVQPVPKGVTVAQLKNLFVTNLAANGQLMPSVDPLHLRFSAQGVRSVSDDTLVASGAGTFWFPGLLGGGCGASKAEEPSNGQQIHPEKPVSQSSMATGKANEKPAKAVQQPPIVAKSVDKPMDLPKDKPGDNKPAPDRTNPTDSQPVAKAEIVSHNQPPLGVPAEQPSPQAKKATSKVTLDIDGANAERNKVFAELRQPIGAPQAGPKNRKLKRSNTESILATPRRHGDMLPMPESIRRSMVDNDLMAQSPCTPITPASLLLENRERDLKFDEMIKRAQRLSESRSPARSPPSSESSSSPVWPPLGRRIQRSGTFGGRTGAVLLSNLQAHHDLGSGASPSPSHRPEIISE
mmetsp:Transcript_12109/g.27961  ORF Transcript_12109/g.27961 Transcript_12109/m.27961 type:complete len:380 (+) Transcript_12109:16-1155(+)